MHNTYDNSVPSLSGDGLEGQTTKTYGLYETMKSVLCGRNSRVGSSVLLCNIG